jgi:hypothetical protein
MICMLPFPALRVRLPVVPAGWFLRSAGVAAPCPQGEYKAGLGADGNCTQCPFGMTTFAEGSTSVQDCKGELAGVRF